MTGRNPVTENRIQASEGGPNFNGYLEVQLEAAEEEQGESAGCVHSVVTSGYSGCGLLCI